MTSPEPPRAAKSPPRRGFRLSLRVWLVLVLAIGTAAGWYLHRVRVQKQAVLYVVNGGGSVRYDWELSRIAGVSVRFPTIPPSAPFSPWRRWLIDHFGPDWVSNVSAVFVGPKNTDSVMANLGDFRQLQLLMIPSGTALTDGQFAQVRNVPSIRILTDSNSPISPRAFANVEALPHLQQLRLVNARIGDDDLEHLAALSHLEYLDIPGTLISNAGLVHLSRLIHLKSLVLIYGSHISDLSPIANLKKLEKLIIYDSPLTDAGLVPIKNFHYLQFLALSKTLITDTGLATLSQLGSLTGLRLDDTAITDAGLLHLRKLPALETLTLLRTRITDAGLSHLSGVKSLKTINVKGTAVTPAGASAFEAANPGVRVYH